jgi:hypothetical protein
MQDKDHLNFLVYDANTTCKPAVNDKKSKDNFKLYLVLCIHMDKAENFYPKDPFPQHTMDIGFHLHRRSFLVSINMRGRNK